MKELERQTLGLDEPDAGMKRKPEIAGKLGMVIIC